MLALMWIIIIFILGFVSGVFKKNIWEAIKFIWSKIYRK
jgi:hypothetical protein